MTENKPMDNLIDRAVENARMEREVILSNFEDEVRDYFEKQHNITVRNWDESTTLRAKFFGGTSVRNYFFAIARRKFDDPLDLNIGDVQNWLSQVHEKITGYYTPVIEVRDSHIRIGLKRE